MDILIFLPTIQSMKIQGQQTKEIVKLLIVE